MGKVLLDPDPLAQTDPGDKLKKTYDWIRQKNAGFKVDFETFKADMGDPEKLSKTHQWLQKNNPAFDVPLEQFAVDMGTPLKKKEHDLPGGALGPEYQAPSTPPVSPPSAGSVATGELNPTVPVIEEPKFDDEADRQKALAILDAQVKAQELRMKPEPVTPLTDMVMAAAKQIYTGFGDMVPMQAAQAAEVGVSAMQDANVEDMIRRKYQIKFQKYVRKKEDMGVFTGFDIDKYIDKYKDQFVKDQGLTEEANRIKANQPYIVNRRKEIEGYVAQQKKESSETLQGVPQSYKQIKSVADIPAYAANMGAQGLWQIPLTIITKGMSGLAMEAATVYDNQIDNLATKHGITREQVIEKNLDAPAIGQTYAVVAAGLDRLSAEGLVDVIKQGGAPLLKTALAATTETLTEPTQGSLEEVGGAKGAKMDTKQAFIDSWTKNFSNRLDEAAGGLFGFGAAHGAMRVAEKIIPEREIKTPEGDLGNEKPQEPAGGTTPVSKDQSQTKEAEKEAQPPATPAKETPATKPAEVKPEPVEDKIPKDLKKKGEPVASTDDAKARFGDGERIFAFHEQGETPFELTSVEQMDKFTSDQLLAYPVKKEKQKHLRPREELKTELAELKKRRQEWLKVKKDQYDPESFAALEKQIADWEKAVGPEKFITPKDIHALAKEAGLDPESKEFKDISKELTGIEHLDDMTIPELKKVKDYINSQEHALPIESTSSVLQHPQEGVGAPGSQRERVEPVQQGAETPKPQIKEESGGKTAEEVTALEAERDLKIKEASRPDIKLTFISSKDLVKATSMEVKLEHDRIKDQYKELKKLIKCLHG